MSSVRETLDKIENMVVGASRVPFTGTRNLR